MWMSENIFVNICNIFGVLCLKIDSSTKCLKLSKFFFIINCLRPVLFIYCNYVAHENMYEHKKETLKDTALYEGKNQSTFAKAIDNLLLVSFLVLFFSGYILQSFKYRKNIIFFEHIRRIKLDEKFKKIFIKRCKFHLFLFCAWLIIINSSVFAFFDAFKAAYAYLMFIVAVHEQISAFLFYLVIKSIEEFLIAYLKQLRDELNQSFNVATIKKLSIDFAKISKVFENFEEAFGLQWTLNTCCQTFNMTINVSIR